MTNPPGIDRGVLRTLLTDAVTGALARRGLDDCLDGAIVRARRTGGRCSVFVFDVDHFKTVNDAYGHLRGDAVLRLIAERARTVVRDTDVLVRYGGDEFVLVLPETAAAEAQQVATRLVDAIGGEPFPGDPPLSVSISLGVATYPDDAADRHGLVELADRRNYLAKRRGRGRAVGDDLQAGGGRRSDRLLERDAAFAVVRDFLVRLDARGRGALRVTGERGAGHSRFLAEVGKLAGMRGFAVRHVGGPVNGAADSAGNGADPAERVLVVADTDADLAEASRWVRRLAGPGGARVVGLVQAVHGPVEPAAPVPLLDTVVLTPLSESALHVWLRTTLRGEPTPELVRWLARRSGGFVASAERGLTQLADLGHLEQGGDGHWGVSAEALARADKARRRLPAAVSSLIGRERDTARVADLLTERRLVTLTGAGGIGKTRLSLAVAGAVADEFADGAVFVSLAEATTTELVVSAVAAALEVPEGTDKNEPLADTVIRALSGLELLLVLDNFEHVLSAGSFVAAVLAAAPGVRVLVTSRQRLRLTGEQVYPVPPLPVPDLDRLAGPPEEAAAVLSASPALALFVSRASEAVYGLTFTPDDLRAAAEVCCRLDGLPLAIELTAANCDVLSPTRILAQLKERLELPATGPQDLPARQQTLRATIDWSFALLDAADQELLTRLAVFAGGCPADAVAAVCVPSGETAGLTTRLAGLVDRNLLGTQNTADGPRYTMLETIRAYAGERLAPGEGVAQRHATYFAAFAERADHGLAGREGATWYTRVSREYLNLRAARTWVMAERDTLTAARIVLGVNRYWQKGWHIREGREWHRRLLEDAVDRPLPDGVRGALMESAAFLAIKQDDQATALSLGEKSLRLGRDLGDLDLVAKALNIVGLVARQSGDLDRARACFGECVEIQESRGKRDGILAAASGNLSMIALFEGDLRTARELLRRDVELDRELGNLRSLLLTLVGLGDVCVDLGDAAAARPLLTEAVEIGRRIGDIGGEAYARHILGRLTRLDGDPVEAYRLYVTAIRQHHGFGDKFAVLYTFSSLIDLLSTAEPAAAARMLGAVEVIREQENTPMTKRQLALRDVTLRRIRAVLSDAEVTAAMTAGRAMDLDTLVAAALEVDPAGLA